MANKLSEPMQEVLRKLGKGWGWGDFGVHGPLSYAARIRTCEALVRRGLLVSSRGDFDLTDAGEAVAKQLNDPVATASPVT
ncbi:hypothetical protein ACYSUW_15135 [Pseudomonas frederiksbergensis]